MITKYMANRMTSIFNFLCRRLASIGKLLGWDYCTARIYICIHLWPLICVMMSLVMLVMALLSANLIWISVCSIYLALNIFGYWAVIRHYYPGTKREIFDRCYFDLMTIAEEWKTSYAVVNLIIYVLLFMAIMTFDALLIMLIK